MGPIFKSLYLIAVITVFFFLPSCDDSGNIPTNNSSLTTSRLKTINSNVDGVYELWVSFSDLADHDDSKYISMGRFNIDANGNIVDTNGGVKTFSFRRAPSNVLNASDAIITIEDPSSTDTLPRGTKILGGSVILTSDFLTFNMAMTYDEILGNIASQFGSDSCFYILNTPSTPGDTTDYDKGIYLTRDNSGNSTGMSSLFIPDSLDWRYEGWIYYLTDSTNKYSIGKFSNPNSASLNPSCGTSGYSKPGADFLTGCPNLNLNNSNWKFMITLEPKIESGSGGSSPFFIRIFDGLIQTGGYSFNAVLPNTANSYLPTAVLKISRN